MRKNRRSSSDELNYIESSLGIVTARGHWFHITSEDIDSIAPGIFEECSLDELVHAAETWVKSADSLSLLLYFVLALVIPPGYAGLLVLLFFTIWHTQKSALTTPHLTTLLKWINADATLIITAGIFLSWWGITEEYVALGIGILYFFLFKLGLLRWGVDALYRKLNKGISLNDRLFKMIIIKYAISRGVTVPAIQNMNQKIQDLMTRNRKKK